MTVGLSDDISLREFNAFEYFLGDLGFVSPLRDKSVNGSGYFLQSCTKVVEDSQSLEAARVLSGISSTTGRSGGLPSILEPICIIETGALGVFFSLSRVSP